MKFFHSIISKYIHLDSDFFLVPRCALAVFAVGRLSVANEMACGCERGPGEREEEKEGVAPSSSRSVVIETTMRKLINNYEQAVRKRKEILLAAISSVRFSA